MGQNASTAKNKGRSPKKEKFRALEVMLTEPADCTDYNPMKDNKRKSSFEKLSITGPSKRAINKAVEFVQDFLPLYIQQKDHTPALTTSPLLVVDSIHVNNAHTTAEKRLQENFERVVNQTEDNLQLGQKILKKQNKQLYKRFSFANQKEELSNASGQMFKGSSFSRQYSNLEQSTPDISKNMVADSFGNSREYRRKALEQEDWNKMEAFQITESQNLPRVESDLRINNIGRNKHIHGSFGQNDIDPRDFQLSSSKLNKENTPYGEEGHGYRKGNNGLEDRGNTLNYNPQANQDNASLRLRIEEEFNRSRSKFGKNMKENTQSRKDLHHSEQENWNGPSQNNNFYNTQPLPLPDFHQKQHPEYTSNYWQGGEPEIPQTNNYHPYSQTQATPLKNYYEEDYDHRHRENTIKGPESNTNARKKWPTQSQSPVPNKMANMNKENPRFDVMRPKSPISVSNNPRKISDNKSPLMQKTLHSPMRSNQVKKNPMPGPTYTQIRQNNQALKKNHQEKNLNKGEVIKVNLYPKAGNPYENSAQPHQQQILKHNNNNIQEPYENKNYYNQQSLKNIDSNQDVDIKPISVDLNLDDLLEAADKNKNYDGNYAHYDYHGSQGNAFNASTQQQQPNNFNGQNLAPKHLDETAYYEEISQIEKKNNSMYMSRYDIAPEDIIDHSVDYNIRPQPQGEVYNQPSNYRSPGQNPLKGGHYNY